MLWKSLVLLPGSLEMGGPLHKATALLNWSCEILSPVPHTTGQHSLPGPTHYRTAPGKLSSPLQKHKQPLTVNGYG